MVKIVIADDEKRFRDYMQRVLDWEGLGFLLCGIAANGEQVLELLEEELPDIALLDINMPKMDGLVLTEKLREISPETYIVFITGYSEFEYARKAIKLGVSEYLLKPFSKEELSKVVLRLKEMVLKRQEEKKQNQRNRRVLLEEFMNKLVRLEREDEREMEEYEDRLEQLGVLLCEPFYVVTMAEPYKLEGNPVSKAERSLWRFGLRNILEEMAVTEQRKQISFWDYGGSLVSVWPCRNKQESASLASFMERFCELVQRLLNLTATVGMGTQADSFYGLSQSYRQAFAAWKENAGSTEGEGPVAGDIKKKPGTDAGRLPTRRAGQIIEEVEKYIEEHYADFQLTAVDISEAVYLDISYIRKIFSKYRDYTIQDRITAVRMKAAREKIEEQAYSIAEIAEMCGYLDAGYFSKCFKKYYHVSPRQYLGRLKEGE